MASLNSQNLAETSQNLPYIHQALTKKIAEEPLTLGALGKHFQGGLDLPIRHQDRLELNFVETGSVSYLIEGQRVNLRNRSLIWIFPGQDHILIDQSPDLVMWVVLWKPEALAIACRHSNSAPLLVHNPPGTWHKRASETMFIEMHRLCEYIRYEGKDPDLLNTGMLFLLSAAWRIYQLADEQYAGDVHPAVARAARLLREQTPTPSVEELAHEVGLSSSRLSRLFRTQIGTGLVPFRNRQSLERFKRIYDKGHSVSIADAAEQAGFGSYAQFHRIFTQEEGCGPNEWRKKLAANSTKGNLSNSE